MTGSSTDVVAHGAVKRLLIAVDSSASSTRAAQYVRFMAVSGAEVRLVCVAENPRNIVPLGALTDAELQNARDEIHRDAADALQSAKSVFAGSKIAVQSDVIDLSRHGGSTGNALVDAADEWHADLLVVGARQHHGLLRWIEGTVSEFATTNAPCSILVVPASYEVEIPESPQRILFALDGSPTSLDAMRFGLQFASPGTHLRAIYVIDRAVRLTDLFPIRVLEDAFVDEGKAVLANAAGVLADLSNPVETGVVSTEPTSDDVSHTIVREALRWRADLVVVGTHGRRGPARWIFGSVAARAARITRTPLLLARP
ncbi:universal stress protein [Paraburkholderia tuberum]|uniref:universal stress protein n=1 Tax=Paraburkholderia tuberum TaxID=157910 RepID=UPI00037CCA04|nr:universal stress protein [Paraburkholderia tuberum]